MCEGKNTEPSYFIKFRLSTAVVRVAGLGISSIELIEKTKRQPDLNRYDEIWCVYDHDDRESSFNSSLSLAAKYGFNVAYSIQSFEYWLLLHFVDHNGSPLHRDNCLNLLNQTLKQFGCTFGKSSGKIIDTKLFFIMQCIDEQTGQTRQELAISRAERIYANYDHTNPAKEDSSTTVFKLVKELTKYG